MKPYSMDLRQRVLKDCNSGMPTQAVAHKYSVSPAWVRRLKQRWRQEGSITLRSATPGPKPLLGPYAEQLRQLVHDHPGLSAEHYRDRLGIPVAVVTVWRALRHLGLTYKKSRYGRPSRTDQM